MRTGWLQASFGALALAIWILSAPALGGVRAVAAAADWVVVPEQSQVLFDYQRNGQQAGGLFARFEGSGVFDADAPSGATLELRIDTTSIDLGDALVSAFATSAEWFDSSNFPQVIYRLVSLTPEDGNNYHAVGELMIRGRTQPIETTINLEFDGDDAHVRGILTLDRSEYRLGVGPSALFVDIGREVAVRFELVARPVR